MATKRIVAALGLAGITALAHATNGMNMEGYGPIAMGMGGAAMAYDVGNAGMINNPATLGLAAPGTDRLALFVGGLMPTVSANGRGSSATSFVMPAAGYISRRDKLTWGVGMMAQGGMGTEYSDGAFWGTLAPSGAGAVNMQAGAARRNLSEVGVGRVLFPMAWAVSDTLTIGGSLDYLWAGMDIQWLVDGAHFADMMAGTRRFGSVSGSMVSTMQGMMGPAGIRSVGWGYVDFNKDGQFYQKATGTGWAGNLGFVWKATPRLTLGGVYHAKTSIADLQTGSGGANVSFNVDFAGGSVIVPVAGKASIRDFQWPETYAFGMAWQATDRWLLAADYKRINWAATMRQFRMSFDAATTQANPMAVAFAGTRLDMNYEQRWENQNVVMLGAAYKYGDATTLRFGVNLANNPIPDRYMSPLFPAIVKNHLTFSLDHALDKASFVHAALSHAPKVGVTNAWASIGAGSNQSVSHGQTNWQLSYGYRF
jgi:long-chain fatty acid transport protein